MACQGQNAPCQGQNAACQGQNAACQEQNAAYLELKASCQELTELEALGYRTQLSDDRHAPHVEPFLDRMALIRMYHCRSATNYFPEAF